MLRTWKDSQIEKWKDILIRFVNALDSFICRYGTNEESLQKIDRIRARSFHASYVRVYVGEEHPVSVVLDIDSTWEKTQDGSLGDHSYKVKMRIDWSSSSSMTFLETRKYTRMISELADLAMALQPCFDSPAMAFDHDPEDPVKVKELEAAREEERKKREFESLIQSLDMEEKQLLRAGTHQPCRNSVLFVFVDRLDTNGKKAAKRLEQKGISTHDHTVRGGGQYHALTDLGTRVYERISKN